MTDMQRGMYCHFLESKAAARLLNAGKGGTNMLSAITSLKKLCNHPKLIYDAIHSKAKGDNALGFEGCEKFFPPGALGGVKGRGLRGRGVGVRRHAGLRGLPPRSAPLLVSAFVPTHSQHARSLAPCPSLCPDLSASVLGPGP